MESKNNLLIRPFIFRVEWYYYFLLVIFFGVIGCLRFYRTMKKNEKSRKNEGYHRKMGAYDLLGVEEFKPIANHGQSVAIVENPLFEEKSSLPSKTVLVTRATTCQEHEKLDGEHQKSAADYLFYHPPPPI